MAEQNSKRTEINTLGEFGLIDHLTKDFAPKNKSTVLGIGDDGAAIDPDGKQVVISTDLLIENIHFDLAYHPLKHLGYKSVIVNLSDIYAMNAKPEQITFSMALSSRFSVEALEEIYAGIAHACDRYGVDLIGGDTTSSLKGLVMSITAMGTVVPEKLVKRNTANIGDLICVSGDLGAAYIGLQLLHREKQIYLENPGVQPDLEDQQYIVGRQLRPEARKDTYEWFQQKDVVPTSMIDISDGLSSDLMHICTRSGVGCKLFESMLPIAKETHDMAVKFNHDPTTCALNGGEDYELLFTINPRDEEMINAEDSGITIIGEVVAEEDGMSLISNSGSAHPLQAQGWNHLKS